MFLFYTKKKFEDANNLINDFYGYPSKKALTYARERKGKYNGKDVWIMSECEVDIDYDLKLKYDQKWEI